MSGAVSLLPYMPSRCGETTLTLYKTPPIVILKEGNNDIYKMEYAKLLLCPTAYEQECRNGLGAKLLAAMKPFRVHLPYFLIDNAHPKLFRHSF
jgi:hypothetical protein